MSDWNPDKLAGFEQLSAEQAFDGAQVPAEADSASEAAKNGAEGQL